MLKSLGTCVEKYVFVDKTLWVIHNPRFQGRCALPRNLKKKSNDLFSFYQIGNSLFFEQISNVRVSYVDMYDDKLGMSLNMRSDPVWKVMKINNPL